MWLQRNREIEGGELSSKRRQCERNRVGEFGASTALHKIPARQLTGVAEDHSRSVAKQKICNDVCKDDNDGQRRARKQSVLVVVRDFTLDRSVKQAKAWRSRLQR